MILVGYTSIRFALASFGAWLYYSKRESKREAKAKVIKNKFASRETMGVKKPPLVAV
jgi:hypothetical protein